MHGLQLQPLSNFFLLGVVHQPPALCLQPSSSSSKVGGARKWEDRIRQLVKAHVEVVERYESVDPLVGFKTSVRRILQLQPTLDIRVVGVLSWLRRSFTDCIQNIAFRHPGFLSTHTVLSVIGMIAIHFCCTFWRHHGQGVL